MKYKKLVRDKIPEIITSKGSTPVTHIASELEYEEKLLEKLFEEMEEFKKDASEEELADILEVIYAIGDTKGVSREKLEEIRLKKREERGGFVSRIILDETLDV
jgi:predicted house-cleaning noncanonical NTP pyrophosphatase (MazG superfamily)